MRSGGGWLTTLESATAGRGGFGGGACVACAYSVGTKHCGMSRDSCRSSCGMEISLYLTVLPFGRPTFGGRGCLRGELLLRPSIQMWRDNWFLFGGRAGRRNFRTELSRLKVPSC
jgi:hypothetical protein